VNKISGIYKISFENTDRVYIGSSINISKRLTSHLRKLRNDTHHNYLLQCHFNKSKELLTAEVILECHEDDLSKEELRLITEYDSFYNGFNLTENTSRTKVEVVDKCAMYKDKQTLKIQMSTDLINIEGLSISESVVYCTMLQVTDDNLQCMLSANSIAEVLGLSEKSVFRAVQTLRAKNLLNYSTVRHKSTCVNIYTINDHYLLKMES